MAENNKDKVEEKNKGAKLDLDDMDQVAGGANPFASIKRVENHQIDDELKKNI